MTSTTRGGHTIISLAVVSEALLLLLAYAIAWSTGLMLDWDTSISHIVIGALCAFPLLVGNYLLYRWTLRHPGSVYGRFSQQVVLPLCRSVTVPQAAIIALLSGICEEALFRGALNNAVIHYAGLVPAVALTSFAFAYVHFIGHLRTFGGMIPLYSLVGAALWLVWYATGSLASVATAHAAYNFLAIVSMRFFERPIHASDVGQVPIGRTYDVPRE